MAVAVAVVMVEKITNMAVLPTFDPNGRPGEAVDSYIQGVNARQSWMDREQSRQINAAQEQRQADLYEMQKPVLQAEQASKIAQIGNELTANVQMHELMTQAQTDMPQLRKDWIDASTQNDRETRLLAMDRVLSVAGKYDSLKGISPEIQGWKNIYAQQHLDKRTNDTLTGRNEIEQLKAQTQRDLAQAKNETAIAVAQARQDAAAALAAERQKWNEERIKLTGQTKVRTESDVARNQGAYKVNNDVVASGTSAMRDAVNLQRGLALLSDPEVRTGTGAGLEVKAERLGQLLGVETKGIGKTEQLQQILGDAVLARVNQTKGSISDKEMTLFDAYSASINKTAEGNAAIMQALLRAKQRDIEVAKMVNDLRRQGADEFQIQTTVDDYRLTHSIWDGITPPTENTDPATVTGGASKPPTRILSIKPIAQ